MGKFSKAGVKLPPFTVHNKKSTVHTKGVHFIEEMGETNDIGSEMSRTQGGVYDSYQRCFFSVNIFNPSKGLNVVVLGTYRCR